MLKRGILSLGLVLAALLPGPARGDVGPPAHLRISEREPGLFVAQWRVPKVLPPNAVPVPELPENCEPLDPFSVDGQAGAWLFMQEWRCDGGLAGEVVGLDFPFVDFALTTVVRVDLLSGDRFAHLLTPGDEPWRIPEGTAGPDRLREWTRAVGFGARHAVVAWAHLPFMLAAGLLGGLRRSIRVVSAFTLGQLCGVLLAVPFPGLNIVPAEIMLALAAVLLAREALRPPGERRRFLVVAGAAGVVHGLAVGTWLAGEAGQAASGLVVQFLSVLGMDAAHLAGAAIVATLAGKTARGRGTTNAVRWLAYVGGASGIALALSLVAEGGAPKPAAVDLNVAAVAPVAQESTPSAPESRRVAPAVPDAPVQSYLVVEPFEVRQEVMLRLGRLTRTLGLDPAGTVDVESQLALSEQLIALVLDGTSVAVDGRMVQGFPRQADFMTVDSTGALPRAEPVPEPVSEAVVGVVVTYPTDGMPQNVSLSWNALSAAGGVVPVAWIDPESTRSDTLTAAEPMLTWENALTEDPIPKVTAVEVEPRRLPLPLLSLPLFLGAAIVVVAGLRRRRVEIPVALARVALALALVLTPVARTSVALPAFAAGAPSQRQARRILAGLLPNVYRAMEFREEGLIFDRLAVSVTGETLTEVYLEQRRTLELEERGGAQARVEAVEILDAREIEAGESGFSVRATWTVAGMVTHFGHRHFRQNRYDARLAIVSVEETWKIRTVEILEQDRLQ